MAKIPNLKLNTGALIPQLGFGIWRHNDPKEFYDSINWALEAGFRHFDGAQAYSNEEMLGEAVKKSHVPREDWFITTKIKTENMGMMTTTPSFDESMQKLDMDYVDLLLLHFPVTEKRDPAWRRLQLEVESGRAKAIGVSNYTVRHLEEMKHFEIQPAANQVELSVFLQQTELVDYCQANGIVVEAYSPLAEGYHFDNPTLVAIAKKHGKTVPQIMLRWVIERGIVALTKSVHKDRIDENSDIFDFELDKDDMAKIKKLDRNFRTNWNPTNVP
jgi:diketogulonate reductase-like aldo/keto reductase